MVSPAPRFPAGALAALLRRLLAGVVTLWAAVTLVFFGLRIAAGDPIAGLLSQGLASAEQAARLRESLGLDDPLLIQYGQFLGDLAVGDLGRSLYTQRPVTTIILEQAAPTGRLAVSGLAVGIALGFALGITAGVSPDTLAGRAAASLAGLTTAIPVAVTGVVILWAATHLAQDVPFLFPITRSGNLLLPALTLGIVSSGALARVLQSGIIENMGAPYMLALRARGIGRGPRLVWHALRPALPLALSFLSLEVALLMSGTVVAETVFARPGLGRLLVSSILSGDFPVVQGLVLLTASLYIVTHVLAEGLSSLIDPRLRAVP